MPGPGDLFAQIQTRGQQEEDDNDGSGTTKKAAPVGLMAALQARTGPPATKSKAPVPSTASTGTDTTKPPSSQTQTKIPEGKLFHYDVSQEAFLFDLSSAATPILAKDAYGQADIDIVVPLAPCVYRMTDYTLAKKEPVLLRRCVLKLGVLRCLARECDNLNQLLWHRLHPKKAQAAQLEVPKLWEDGKDDKQDEAGKSLSQSQQNDWLGGSIEEDELGKARFMELLSNCGVYQKVSELVLQRAAQAADEVTLAIRNKTANATGDSKDKNVYRIPHIRVDGLEEFLQEIETLFPSLQQARDDIEHTQTVSFYPGLGELFCPGSKLLCYPEGMEGSPLGCSCVQSWYAEELNKATGKVKRRFVLVVEFIVSVGDKLVFVAASDVYPEFHDPSRSVPLKDLTHRKLDPDRVAEDAALLQRLQQRGEFYASVATHNHYLEYYPHSFFPIIGGGWSNNAVRPMSKGGRVMVDVKRGILEGHMPVRGTADGMSDTVKEAIKLFEQSKRTGVAVPFRTCILPGFGANDMSKKKKLQMGELAEQGDSDRPHLWQSWPMLTGFSFTARVWGKLLLGMPKAPLIPSAPITIADNGHDDATISPRRSAKIKMGVEIGGLGGEGSCGNCGYICFQEQAFEQLVLAEDKKELIRAVARNAGGGTKWDDDSVTDFEDDDDDDDDDDIALDVVANKGGASIFLLHGPPGCGKTLTAEAISELLKKPLYIVTAGDLGITAAEVEKSLGSVLELCQTWDALVLIDEADIFLEARNSTEIQRNALVCVMLRLLEYYTGCLFLSSNRSARSIDAAIASRITVMLGYPALDVEGRAKVWKNLIELVPSHPVDPTTGIVPDRISKNPRKASRYRVDFSDADYQNLANGCQLNGRQIKNSIVLARALARERGIPLSLPVLERAVTAVAGEGAAV
jgi:DNA replication protein DnaC